METMDEDTNAARITTLRERREHLRQRLASLHAEHALVENELTSLQGSPGVVEAADVPIEDRVTCKHFCVHHTSLMDPAVWRNLPEEVLQMVFARLPLLRIVSLQCLSKAWRWKVTAAESGFRRLCAGVQKPNVFALADHEIFGSGDLTIRMFDVEAHKWHVFEMTLQEEFACDTMAACDGGLVCYVSRMVDKAANPLRIVVLNPLTKEYKVLPTLGSLNKVQPQMVQLIMDRETKCYKVVLVWEKNRRTGTVLAKVYSSATGRWSNPDTIPEHLVFGYHFRWRPDRDDDFLLLADQVGPCAYACHEAEFLKLGDHVTPSLDSCKRYALVNDRLFVLHNETRHYTRGTVYLFFLLEYQGQRSSPYWVRVRVHDCTPLKRSTYNVNHPLPENYYLVLHACRDYLMITVQNSDLGAFKLIRMFLYDLSTFKWQEIPAVPGGIDQLNEAMYELHWDAVP